MTTMRAVRLLRAGEPPVAGEFPLPQLGEQGVLIRVHCAGVNPIDWKQLERRPAPFTCGQDVAGVVERVGSAVTGIRAGDRIVGLARTNGGFAEFTVIDQGRGDSPFASLPDGVGDAVAAALPTPGLTALAALARLEVGRGSDLLITGGVGAVGATALQVAVQRGAAVTVTVRADQVESARRYGATTVVVADGDLVARLREAHPAPFALVFDTVGDATTVRPPADVVAPSGVLVCINGPLDQGWFGARGINASHLVMNQTPQSSPEGLRELTELVRSGALVVPIERHCPLAEGPAVLAAMKAGRLRGKTILDATATAPPAGE